MPLSVGKEVFKGILLEFAHNQDETLTKEEVVQRYVDALEAFIKSATVVVPGTGLVAPPTGGPVTGVAVTGTLE